MKLRGVVFDLDGVITDTSEYHYQAWKALGEELGFKINRTFNEELKGLSRQDSLAKLLAFGRLTNQFSKQEKEELAAKKNDSYLKLIETITPKDILPGIKEFILELKGAGIKLSIASASRNAPTILKKLKLLEEFQAIVNPAELLRSKPDPEIFIKGAHLLGLEPTQCIGIEDAVAGIKGIIEANMFSIGIGDSEVLRAADLVLPTTKALTLAQVRQAYKGC